MHSVRARTKLWNDRHKIMNVILVLCFFINHSYQTQFKQGKAYCQQKMLNQLTNRMLAFELAIQKMQQRQAQEQAMVKIQEGEEGMQAVADKESDFQQYNNIEQLASEEDQNPHLMREITMQQRMAMNFDDLSFIQRYCQQHLLERFDCGEEKLKTKGATAFLKSYNLGIERTRHVFSAVTLHMQIMAKEIELAREEERSGDNVKMESQSQMEQLEQYIRKFIQNEQKKISKYVTYEENEEILKKYFKGRIKKS